MAFGKQVKSLSGLKLAPQATTSPRQKALNTARQQTAQPTQPAPITRADALVRKLVKSSVLKKQTNPNYRAESSKMKTIGTESS